MMHSDIQPEGFGWLDKLLDEARKHDATIVSSVNAIKNETGITSTALLCPKTRALRRLTMREVHKLPVTFDATTAGYPGQILCINTGLWVADLRGDWPDRWIASGGCFRNLDRIVHEPDGNYAAHTFSEDWVFACDLHKLGVKAMATRAVKAKHRGEFDFPNDMPWGTWSRDESVVTDFDDAPPADGNIWPRPSREPIKGKIHAIRSDAARPVTERETAAEAR